MLSAQCISASVRVTQAKKEKEKKEACYAMQGAAAA